MKEPRYHLLSRPVISLVAVLALVINHPLDRGAGRVEGG